MERVLKKIQFSTRFYLMFRLVKNTLNTRENENIIKNSIELSLNFILIVDTGFEGYNR